MSRCLGYGCTINRLYRYDPTYRLTNETINGLAGTFSPVAVNYEYDAVGNRLNQLSTLSQIPSTSYGYDLNDRLSSDSYVALPRFGGQVAGECIEAGVSS